jgi:hypothetical protein
MTASPSENSFIGFSFAILTRIMDFARQRDWIGVLPQAHREPRKQVSGSASPYLHVPIFLHRNDEVR